jgi:hypothetical protein
MLRKKSTARGKPGDAKAPVLLRLPRRYRRNRALQLRLICWLDSFHQSRQLCLGDVVVPDFLNYGVFTPRFDGALRFVIVVDPDGAEQRRFVKSRRRFLQIDTGRKYPFDRLANHHRAVTAQHHRVTFSQGPGHRVALLDRVNQGGIHVNRHRAGAEERPWIGLSRIERFIHHA